MNIRHIFSITILVLAVGCVYDRPLSEEHTISIDPKVLGFWEAVPEKGNDSKKVHMLVLKYSDTEYLVHYPIGKDAIYYRAYPIKVGGVSCVQAEVIGVHDGPYNADTQDDCFHVISYEMDGDSVLIVKTLNPDIVAKDIGSSKELKKAFVSNRDDPGLFRHHARFSRIGKDE